ncbi:hypothetical protein LXL04_023759 [Taraxacum kok-saghyz]
MDITATTPIVTLIAKNNFPIKWTASNFPAWKSQVHYALVGLGLDGYVDGTITTPAKYIDAARTLLNRCYTIWYRQDKTIIGSCSNTIRPVIAFAITSRQHGKNFLLLTQAHVEVSSPSKPYLLVRISSLSMNTDFKKRPHLQHHFCPRRMLDKRKHDPLLTTTTIAAMHQVVIVGARYLPVMVMAVSMDRKHGFLPIGGHKVKHCPKLQRFLRDNKIPHQSSPVVNGTSTSLLGIEDPYSTHTVQGLGTQQRVTADK